MPDPNLQGHFDPEKAGAIVGMIGAFIGAVLWPFKVFQTRKGADERFVKKVEADGSRIYVHANELKEMKEIVEVQKSLHSEALEENRKWQKIAKDWVENP